MDQRRMAIATVRDRPVAEGTDMTNPCREQEARDRIEDLGLAEEPLVAPEPPSRRRAP